MSILSVLLILILVFWQLYKKFEQENHAKTEIQDNYIQIEAEIKRVSVSGVRTKRSTILYVDYTYKGESSSATIRRSGYEEGRYNKGDTTVIYIDPNNSNNIR